MSRSTGSPAPGWTLRSAVAAAFWAAAGLLTLFLVFSGWWILVPFALAGGGGKVLYLVLAIALLAGAAYLLGRGQLTR